MPENCKKDSPISDDVSERIQDITVGMRKEDPRKCVICDVMIDTNNTMFYHYMNECYLPQYCIPWLCCPGCGENFSGPDVCRDHCLTAHGSDFRKDYNVNGFERLQVKQVEFFLLVAKALNLCSQDEPVNDDLYAMEELMCTKIKSYARGSPALMNENFRAQADCLKDIDFRSFSKTLPGENSVRLRHLDTAKHLTQISLKTVLKEKFQVTLSNFAIVMMSHPRINALLVKLVYTNYPECASDFQFTLGLTCASQEFEFQSVGPSAEPAPVGIPAPQEVPPEDISPESPNQNSLSDQAPVDIPIDSPESYYDPEVSMESVDPPNHLENNSFDYCPPSPMSSEGRTSSESEGSIHDSVLDSSQVEEEEAL
jgi:hypothetical protein